MEKIEDFILDVMDKLPQKKMKRTSRVNQILQTLYDSTEKGKIIKFDPAKAKINPDSLRYQLRTKVRQGFFSKGTKIVSRNKEWYFTKG